ncbi:MAG TPA: hypothetical protein VF236_03420 [Gaiellaceae bacterium]
MQFPNFKDDREMGAWFEENDVDPDDLDVADDVTISRDLTVALEVAIFSVTGPGTGVSANAPATVEGDREQDLTPALS